MATVKADMLDQIHSKVHQLESAINRISRTKKQLKENALMAKDGIHTTISRHLETLRNREVWLLGQVDLLEHAKEDLMRQQQAELNQAIGGLKNALELMDDQNLLNQLQEVLQRVEKLKLSPDETPYLTFRADPLTLREAIQEYGQVDTRSLPIQRAFVSHESSSTSLPRAFEDYEDVEHHMLYKTVHSLQNDMVQVSIPRLAKDEWLYQPKVSSNLPVRPASIPSYLDKMSSDSASIKNWLCEIKHEGDMEEDHDFEMVNGMSSSPDSENLPSPEYPFKHLSNIANSPLGIWLKQRSSPSCPFDALRYFQHISNNVTDWLADYKSDQKTQSDDQIMSDNCTNQDYKEWLKKHDTKPSSNAPIFEPFHTPSDTATWLLSKKPSKDCADWLISSTPSTEVEATESAPLFEYFQKVSNDPTIWLKKANDPETVCTPLFDYFCKISDNSSMWLRPKGGASDSGVGIEDEELPVEITSIDVASWLVNTTNQMETQNFHQPSQFGFDSFFQNLNNRTWLKQPSNPPADANPGVIPPSGFTLPCHSDGMGNMGDTPSSCSSSPVMVDMEDGDEFLDKWLHPSRRQVQMSNHLYPTNTVV